MSEVTLYHNPRCSKSRQTLTLLKDRGIQPMIVEYLSQALTADAVARLLEMLGLEPRQLMRRNEAVYKELGLDSENLGHQALISAMVENPILIERPIVVSGNRAILGRPPENVLSIL